MNVLVVGCGRLGSQVAMLLDAKGHDVAVVEENPNLFYRLPAEFSGMTIAGIPMDLKVLKSAGVENCDMAAIVTPDDNLNITVSQIVQQFFRVQNVVTRISDPEREEVFAAFGLRTVCPTNLAGDVIVQALLDENESRQVSFGTASSAFHVRPVERDVVGMKIRAMIPHGKEVPFAVLREDGRMILTALPEDGELAAEDYVVWATVID